MAYGITAISVWNESEDKQLIIKNIIISENEVNIVSGASAVAIGAVCADCVDSRFLVYEKQGAR